MFQNQFVSRSYPTLGNLWLNLPGFFPAGFPLTHWPSLLARFAIALQLTCACSGVYIPLARAALTHLIIGLTSGAPQGGRDC